MKPDDQLSALFAASLEQQEVVKAAVDSFVQERAELLAIVNSIKNASRGLQTATGAAATTAVTESLGKAPKAAVEALNAATGALDDAAGRVRDAGAWISWKFAVVFAFAGAAAVATNYAIGRFTLPDRAEIEALRSEKAELEANITDLHKRGARIKINTCGGRICIEASTNQGKDAAGNSATMGSWLTTDGRNVPLVIPRGY